MSVQEKYTYRDLLTIPDDGNRYEIFEGKLVKTPPPLIDHQRVVTNLIKLISKYADPLNLGMLLSAPVDVYFDEETTLEPDILFVSNERLKIVERDRINGAPDVVVEIISESTESRDRGFKFKRYAQEGVKEYWIVDPSNKSIEIYRLKGTGLALAGKISGTDELESPYFTSLKIAANRVFE